MTQIRSFQILPVYAAPLFFPETIRQAVQGALEEHARLAEEAAKRAIATGTPQTLRRSILGSVVVERFYPPPSRRERVQRCVAEARRRAREALLILRTGETSYDESAGV
jgi:hypothetical protein